MTDRGASDEKSLFLETSKTTQKQQVNTEEHVQISQVVNPFILCQNKRRAEQLLGQ